MAWELKTELRAETTRNLVHQVQRLIGSRLSPITIVTDGGSENLSLSRMDRVVHQVAQVDIVQSNSLVESLWSQMKSRWLYCHTLDSLQVTRPDRSRR